MNFFPGLNTWRNWRMERSEGLYVRTGSRRSERIGRQSITLVPNILGETNMEKRNAARYAAVNLPAAMTSASLVFPDNSVMESTVVDISSIGIKLKVSPAGTPPIIPRQNDILKIRLLSKQIELTSLCMWSTALEQGIFDLGFYFYNPHEQNSLYEILKCFKMSSRYNESF